MPNRLPEAIPLHLRWEGTQEIPIDFINQFAVQPGDLSEIVVTFGQAATPPLMGTPEEQAEQARQIEYLPIKPIARFAFTRAGAERLASALRTILEVPAPAPQEMRGDENVP